MIKLKRCSEIYGDETASYDVELTTTYTVEQFVNEVVSNSKEWGAISIMQHRCEYKWGKLIRKFPEFLMCENIVQVSAHGGWSMMNYTLQVRNTTGRSSES